MKVLIIMAGFFPGKKYGGPPVSVDNFCSLMKEYECYILTRNHEMGETAPYTSIQDGWNFRGNCKVAYLSDSDYNKGTFEKIIEELKPDMLYLQGLFQSCIFPCLQLAKKYNIHVILAPRGELCDGALNIKKYKKMPYISLVIALGLVENIHFQSTSDEETEAIHKLLKINRDKIHRLDNIPSIPNKEYVRGKKSVGEGRFVFLSRIHPKKNLLGAIKYFHGIQGKAYFDIYGPIEDEAYWDECQKEISKLPANIAVKYKGLVGHDQVHEVFSQYDAFLFPTFSENYGHVIAESLIVGTPVIISDKTPWNEVKEYGAGWVISLDDEENYAKAIQNIVNIGIVEAQQFSKNAKTFCAYKLKVGDIRIGYMNAINSIMVNVR